MSLTKKKNIRKVEKKTPLNAPDVVIVKHTIVSTRETSKLKKINEMLRNAKLQNF